MNNYSYVCERREDMQNYLEENKINKIMDEMPDEEELYDLAELFKVFGDSTRIRIIQTLFLSEMAVGEMAAALQMTQSAISHQLRVLKQAKLVKYRKVGKVAYYSLSDDHVKQIFDQGLSHIQE
ncbi:MAG: metalloregulator ArsR/SmtB family transcription factor [Bacillota bacterium]|nr:metalloregulator ArsR/SmtB family transcription factor [Bacillota bacterium]